MNRVTGTAGKDTIAWWGVSPGVLGMPSDGPDEILAGLESDLVVAGGGDDLVFGDERLLLDSRGGDDRIDAGLGNDIVWGDGDATRYGGDDVIVGGPGDDVLYGDTFYSLRIGGWDILKGGEGNDRLYGDSAYGTESRGFCVPLFPPFVTTSGGADRLMGEAGDDFLLGGTGNDVLIGGRGADTFAFSDFKASDCLGRSWWLGSGFHRVKDFRSGEDRLDLTGWELDGVRLDTNRNGRIGKGDLYVSTRKGGLVIDLEGASGRPHEGYNEILLKGVRWISVDDLVPLSPEV